MRTCLNRITLTLIALLVLNVTLQAQELKQGPVTPDPSPEATALLELFQSITGKYILTGQHNYPNTKDKNTSI